jgi:hypothetical protein
VLRLARRLWGFEAGDAVAGNSAIVDASRIVSVEQFDIVAIRRQLSRDRFQDPKGDLTLTRIGPIATR